MHITNFIFIIRQKWYLVFTLFYVQNSKEIIKRDFNIFLLNFLYLNLFMKFIERLHKNHFVNKSEKEMSKVDVLNEYHLELLLAFVDERREVFEYFSSTLLLKLWHFG